MSNGKKRGLATKEEIKVLWQAASGVINIPVILRPIANIVIPSFIDGLDNKVGDRILEPWQTHCENLVSLTVTALEDKKITIEEAQEISDYAAVVLNEQIDLPLVGEDVEAVMFMETLRMLAVFLHGLLHKK